MAGGNAGIERLTDRRVASWAKGGAGPALKLADGGGLSLVRLRSGGASWQLKYRIGGVERTYSIGPIDKVTLTQARKERGRAKELVSQGIDPVQARRVARAANIAAGDETFAKLAERWLAKERPAWSKIHFTKSKRALERDVLPTLGGLPVRDITPAIVAHIVKGIQSRGVRDTAAKVLQHVRAIFNYGIAEGMRADNPALAASEILERVPRVKPRPALLTFVELGDVLRRAEVANITPAVRLCHRLVAFTAVRISNAVAARWADMQLDAKPAVWTIPRQQMKVRGRAFDHKVVLAPAIADELRAWRKAQGDEAGGYVFPGNQGREYLSREAVEKALRVTLRLADQHSCHGWRASFSTLAKDAGQDRQVVDLALDHIHDTDVARAYDRGERLQQRIELAEWWGDALTKAQHGADVLPIRGVA